MPLSLLAMVVIAAAAAAIYWSAPLAVRRLPDTVEQDLPTAFVPHAAVDLAASAEMPPTPAPLPSLEADAVPEPGSSGTRADRLAVGERVETDLLTGLLAPESFFARLSAELTRCTAANLNAILVICDLDSFGELNRSAGLVDANRLLRQVADGFRLTVREGDMLARLGADEFGLFFPGLPPEVAETRVRDLRAAVREAASLAMTDSSSPVTVSVGMSCFPRDGESAEALLQIADAALAAAKRERSVQTDRPLPSALVLTRN